MGRPEKAIDPQDGPVQRLAYELRKLRDEAGTPAYRAMTRRAGYSASVLSTAAAGERLPSLPVFLAYVRACGGDEGEWQHRWEQVNEELAAQPRPDEEDGDPPYRGLARFEPRDAELFFGRGETTERLEQMARRHRVSAVVGASGSGKSSLLRAGLIPRLRRTDQEAAQIPSAVRVLTPGAHPMGHAERLKPADGPQDTWLLVDQFEELFTLCADPGEREAFLDCLLTARKETSQLRVVLAVRADFFGRCTEHPALTAALNDATLLAGPMGTEELRAAIVRPAQARGLNVERELTARILEEVADQPGALPLMSHALMETWRRRRGRTLTTQSYEAAGGLHGAIARTAEDAYHQLTPAQAVLARRVLLRLIAPGDGTQDTHRPTPHSEFVTTDGHGIDVDTHAVIDRLAGSRLLSLDDGHVRLAHEALITAWPRLLGWINDERDRLRLHRKFTHDATTWHELDRDPGSLYRGTRLTQAEESFASPQHNELNALEAAFLEAGLAARDVEHARAVRAKRRSRRSMAALAVLCVLALVAGTIAWEQKRHSDMEHMQAEARRTATVAASLRTTDPVRAMRLSLAAWNLAHTPETRGALLSAALSQHELDAMPLPDDVDPMNVHLSGDGRTLLYLGKDRVRRWDIRTHHELAPLRASGSELSGAYMKGVTRDGQAALVDARRWRVYSITGGKTMVFEIPSLNGEAEFSGNGRTLLTTENNNEIQLWDWMRQRLLLRRQIPKSEPEDRRTVVDSRGRYVASCSDKYPLAVWAVAGNHTLKLPLSSAQKRAQCAMSSLQFTPDSRGLLTVQEGKGAGVLDLESGRTRWSVKHSGLTQVRLSDNGKLLVGQDADEILLWRTSRPQQPIFRYPVPNEDVSDLQIDTDHHVIRYLGGRAVRSISYPADQPWRAVPAEAARFSPDGQKLAVDLRARSKRRFQLLNADDGSLLTELPPIPCPRTSQSIEQPCYVLPNIAFRSDGRRLAYHLRNDSPHEQSVHVWDLRTRDLVPVPRAFQLVGENVLFSANGESLLTSAPRREDLRIWDTRRHTVGTLRDILDGRRLVAAHPNGHSLVVSSGGEKAIGRLLDLRTRRIGHQALTGDRTSAVAFSLDGRLLAAGDTNGWVTVWDGEGRRRLGQLPVADGRTPDGRTEGVSAVAFSPDGTTLAIAGNKGTVRLWDTASNQPLGDALPTIPNDQALALTFTTNGDTLRVATQHTPVQNFNTVPAAAARSLCQRAGGGLTPDEWHTYLPDIQYRTTC